MPSNFAGFSLPSGLDFGVELFIRLFDESFNRLFVNAVIWLFGKSVNCTTVYICTSPAIFLGTV